MFAYHNETTGLVNASADRVFAHLDDHARLSTHMTKSSWTMGGGRMEISSDAGRGQLVGSHIRLGGRVFGVQLFVEEEVLVHEPPTRKEWETIGAPRLLVIGAYRMGFTLAPAADGCQLRVSIDYDVPEQGLSRLLGRMFSGYYARWCTRRMVLDASDHFALAAA